MITKTKKLSVLFVAALLLVFASSAQANPVAWTRFLVTDTNGFGGLGTETVVSAQDWGPIGGTTTLNIGSTSTPTSFNRVAAIGGITGGGGWNEGPTNFPNPNFQDPFINTSPFGGPSTTGTIGNVVSGRQYRLSVITYDGQETGNFPMTLQLNEPGSLASTPDNRASGSTSLAVVFQGVWTSSITGALDLTLTDNGTNFNWQAAGLLLQDLTPPPPNVPEPSTYALGLVGLAGLGLVVWRRRRRA